MTDPTDDLKVAFIKRVAAAARSYSGVTPALVVIAIAQAIQESGWGTSELSTRACNFYGAAADLGDHDPHASGVYTLQSNWEVVDGKDAYGPRDFYAYPSMAASVASHLDFITGRTGVAAYQQRPIPDDSKALAAWLCTAPRAYATDPEYVPALEALIDRWQLAQYAPDTIADAPTAAPIELQRQADAATAIAPKENPMGSIAAMSAAARQIDAAGTGYSQPNRWSFWDGHSIIPGKECDCSSSTVVIVILGGYPLTFSPDLNTRNLGPALIAAGLRELPYDPAEQLLEGDIVNAPAHHVVYSFGGGYVLSAEYNELGTASGGQPGDQTGREVRIRTAYDMTAGGTREAHLYRPPAGTSTSSGAEAVQQAASSVATSDLPTIHRDSSGDAVKAWTHYLHSRYSYARTVADGASWFGADTDAATREFQRRCGLTVDGVVGPKTWAAAAREGFTR